MNAMPIEPEVLSIIAETLEIPHSEVRLETNLRALPGVESIKVLDVILRTEKRYGIEIPDEATFRVETVQQFVDLVRARLQAQES